MKTDIKFLLNTGFITQNRTRFEKDGVVVDVRTRSVRIQKDGHTTVFYRRKERYLWRYFVTELLENDWDTSMDRLYKKIDDMVVLVKAIV